MSEPQTLRIKHLGHLGDGVAISERGPVFIAGTLVGELVEAEVSGDRGKLLHVIEPAEGRIAPSCVHFGRCGGCIAQHMAPAVYDAWKRESLQHTLEQEGLTAELLPTVHVPPGARRRVVLALGRTDHGPVLGFHEGKSSQIVPITQCLVADPAIVKGLPVLSALLGPFAPPKGTADVSVLATRNGLDVSVTGTGKLSPKQRESLILGAERHDIARITVGGEILVTYRSPTVDVGGAPVVMPPGGFVQAAASAEEALGDVVCAALKKSKRVADLFSGSGAFALRLARHSSVHAVESEAGALAALDLARRQVAGLKTISFERRDLFRHPLQRVELKELDGIALDPPRQGATPQCELLAKSEITTIAYVSCNPASFARDARILIDAGYTMKPIVPVDQFLWSPHLELVTSFTKPAPRPKRRS